MNFDSFFSQNNNKFIEAEDPSNKNQFDNSYQLWDNKDMKVFIVHSPKYGKFEVLLDDKDYDSVSSLGKWNVSISRGKPYIQKRFKVKELVQLHRFLLQAKKGTYVDHIDRNPLNNQRSNLRICTNAANLRNGRLRPNNTTGHTGVYYFKHQPLRPWVAKIRVSYKYIHLGSYSTYEEAVIAREKAQVKYWNT